LLEIQVALVVFGVATAGLCPLVVMQARLLRKVETQAVGASNPQLIRGVRVRDGAAAPGEGNAAAPSWTVLQPQPDAWVRRLGGAASFEAIAPSQGFTPLPTTATVDDADAGFAAIGWSRAGSTSAVGGGYTAVPSHAIVQPAVWSFDSLTPGRYHVSVSWVGQAGNARDATYMFVDGAGQPSVVRVDQTTTSGDGPPYWFDLGVVYLGASFQVSLGPSATGQVVADAVQLVPAGALNTVTISRPAAPAGSGGGLTVGFKVVGP
jgi:hypothetical protein